ncbi:MAG: hypothetical protein M3619_11295 [Myxococcota bacterium]|nr:hypothetical protein [Myxococcota bacterium]
MRVVSAVLFACVLSASLGACSSAHARKPAWPKQTEPEVDGGESLAPRNATAVAAHDDDDADADDADADDDEVVTTPKPTLTTPSTDAKPTPTTPTATVIEDVVITEEIVIEIDDD